MLAAGSWSFSANLLSEGQGPTPVGFPLWLVVDCLKKKNYFLFRREGTNKIDLNSGSWSFFFFSIFTK